LITFFLIIYVYTNTVGCLLLIALMLKLSLGRIIFMRGMVSAGSGRICENWWSFKLRNVLQCTIWKVAIRKYLN